MKTETDFRPTGGVYGLIDPRSGRMMYVGQSIDIDYRYRQHCNIVCFDGNLEKHHWIADLRRCELSPTLVILRECAWPESDDVEKQLISRYRLEGQCELNIAPGGMYNRSSRKADNAHPDDKFQLLVLLNNIERLITESTRYAGRIGGAKYMDKLVKVSRTIKLIEWDLCGPTEDHPS